MSVRSLVSRGVVSPVRGMSQAVMSRAGRSLGALTRNRWLRVGALVADIAVSLVRVRRVIPAQARRAEDARCSIH